MKQNLASAIVISGLLAAASQSLAEPVQIFSANTQCQFVNSASGPRYTAPCRTADVSVQPASPSPLRADSPLRAMTFIQHSEIEFSCKSLRPIKITWSYGSQGGELAPGKTFTNDTPTTYDGESWYFQTDLATNGIQAFYPDCGATVTSNFLSPDVAAVKLVGSIFYRADRSFGLVFDAVTPSADATTLINSIDEALDTVELLAIAGDSDPFVASQLENLKTSLTSAKTGLTQNCGAGSTAELCSKETAAARAIILTERDALKTDYTELKAFLSQEIERLNNEGTAAAAVAQELQTTLNGLK